MSDAPRGTRQPEPAPTPPERSGMRAFLFSVGGLVMLLVPVPGLAVLGLGMVVAGVVAGVRARRRARRVLTQAPGSVAAIVIGSIGICFSVAELTLGLVLAGELVSYHNCQAAALTNTDKQSCQDEYMPRFERKLHLPKGFLDHTVTQVGGLRSGVSGMTPSGSGGSTAASIGSGSTNSTRSG